MAGFFGKMPKPFTGSYHPSVYAKYARGGVTVTRLGPGFAYTRPKLADGGAPSEDYARGGNVAQQEADRYLRQNIGGGWNQS